MHLVVSLCCPTIVLVAVLLSLCEDHCEFKRHNIFSRHPSLTLYTGCWAQNGCSSQSIMTAPAPDSSTQVLNGDLQLLVPAWRFSSMGYVFLWQAIVQGNASNSAIDFQIFRPVSQQNGVYELVYGNEYNDLSSQSGNNVSVMVDRNSAGPEIPVSQDYIIGIRLRNSTPGADPSFGLQYSNSTTGAGVDVYYWQDMGSQACTLSICDSSAGVLREVIPLVSWRFCELTMIEPLYNYLH